MLVCVTLFSVSFAVPSKAAMGEHVHFKISLSQSDAFSTLTNWTVHSEGGEIKPHFCELLFPNSLVQWCFFQ